MRDRVLEFVPGLLAGIAGGVGGYFLVAYLLTSSGFWLPVLPGAFAGLACGQLSPVISRRRGVVLALFVVGLVIFTQWKLWVPAFEFDGSLLDYAKHIPQLPPITLIVMAINVVIAYWWGREQGISFARRFVRSKPAPQESDTDLA